MASRPRANPALEFLRAPRGGAPLEVLRDYAAYLLREANAYRLPVPLDRIARRYELPVYREALTVRQRGFSTTDLSIFLNSDDRSVVQNYTFAHELMEFFFQALGEGAADEWMRDDVYVELRNQKERYCELGAAELLLPEALFRPLFGGSSLTFAWAGEVAQYCGVSLTATVCRALQVGLADALLVIWSQRQRKRDAAAGERVASDSQEKMRISWVCKPLTFDGYIPRQMSAPGNSLVERAFRGAAAMAGWDELDLGCVRGKFYVEAKPFQANGERRVMSIIHLPPGRRN